QRAAAASTKRDRPAAAIGRWGCSSGGGDTARFYTSFRGAALGVWRPADGKITGRGPPRGRGSLRSRGKPNPCHPCESSPPSGLLRRRSAPSAHALGKGAPPAATFDPHPGGR